MYRLCKAEDSIFLGTGTGNQIPSFQENTVPSSSRFERPTYLNNYLPTYLLTAWSRVLLEKLTGSQLVKKFPTFYGNQTFNTALTVMNVIFYNLETMF